MDTTPTVRARDLTVHGDGVEIVSRVLWTGEAPSRTPLILLHTKRGIDEETIGLANRLVGLGLTVVVPDLLARVGGSRARDEAAARPSTRGIPREWLVEDLRAVVDALDDDLGGLDHYLVVGFVYGGVLGWRLADHDPRCRALVDVRGRPPSPDDIEISGVSCLVILVEGFDDDKVEAARHLLASCRHGHLETVPAPEGADVSHGLDPAGLESVWERLEDWIRRHP